MSDLPEDVEFALIFTTADAGIADTLQTRFPDATVSSGDNFVGGAEIAAFLVLAKDALASVLGFVSANRDRVKDAKISIGRNQISLEGYSADDVEKLLESQGFKNAVASVKR